MNWGNDDVSGSDGGATNLRIDNTNFANRIMVVADGSGAACVCEWPPSESLYDYYPIENIYFVRSESVNQNININDEQQGLGSNGKNADVILGSGGGCG